MCKLLTFVGRMEELPNECAFFKWELLWNGGRALILSHVMGPYLK